MTASSCSSEEIPPHLNLDKRKGEKIVDEEQFSN